MINPIYRPKGKAAEYSHLALNLYTGCNNGCTYCYAPSVLHITRKEFVKVKPREGILEALRKQLSIDKMLSEIKQTHRILPELELKQAPRVLLCFACDPYPPCENEIRTTRRALNLLTTYDLPFQILTKSGNRALVDKDLYGPNDAFASTLTFTRARDSKKWEPNAALPVDRMVTLQKFHDIGIHTWVSLEPVIDPEQTLELIKLTAQFVDLYKVGTLNYLKSDINWRLFGGRAVKILEALGKNYYIKADLAKHMAGIEFTNTDNRTAQQPD